MKKYSVVFIVLLLISTFSFAQKQRVKVKVKKEVIEANGNAVAKIIELEKDNLIFSIQDLSGNEVLKVVVNKPTYDSQLYLNNWMTVSGTNFEQVNVVDYDMISFGFSPDADLVVSENLIKKYGIFSEAGLNEEKLNAFFSKERISQNKENKTGYGGVEKDGVLTFDKTPVSKIYVKDSLITYTSLDNSKTLNVIEYDYVVHLDDRDAKFEWLELTDDKGRSVELKKETMSTFGNSTKQISALLSKKYNLLTVDGISNLDGFYAIKRRKLSDEYTIVLEKFLKDEAIKKSILDSRRPLYTFNEAGDIFDTKNNDDLGRFIAPKSLLMTSESTTEIQVGERTNKKILHLKPVSSTTFHAKFFDGEELFFRTENTDIEDSETRKALYSDILNFIIVQEKDSILELGYDEFKSIRKEKAIENYNKRKALSPNIYGQPGYVIDEDGEKREGKISIHFEELINPAKDVDDSVVFKNVAEVGGGSSKYGKEVQLEFVNEKGKTKKDTFKSNNGIEFYLTGSNGNETVYRGIKTNIDEFEAALMAASLNFNYSSFYLIESEDNNNTFYKDPLTLTKGIKVGDNERGLSFFSESSEKNYLKLKKYLSDCENLPESFKNLDYTKQESITTILNYYNSSCK